MEVCLVVGGMPFGPKTLQHRSLGGSEQAGLLMALELAKAGHSVTCFANLPKKGPDAIEPTAIEAGVRWLNMEQYENYIKATELDLLVVQRDPRLLNLPHQARKAVMWAHDLATHNWTKEATSSLGTNWSEVWCVSEFHRQQFHDVTGYPLDRIRATRNGILPLTTMPLGPRGKTLIYAARPERGLEHLVKEGGIMDMLKGSGLTLKVCMYANFPPQLEEYYKALWSLIEERPDCEMLGTLKQTELRQHMADAWAYVYCTDFEETSCIIMRECAEQGLPVIYSPVGALPETIKKGTGIAVPGEARIQKDNPETYKRFAKVIKDLLKDETKWNKMSRAAKRRKDLTWEGVAKDWDEWAQPSHVPTLFSHAWSMVEDSDVIPAIHLLEKHRAHGPIGWAAEALYQDLKVCYPFLSFDGKKPERSLKDHYDKYYAELEGPKTNHMQFHDVREQPRWHGLHANVSKLPAGSKILDYACGEGCQLIALARENADKDFYGIDIAEAEIDAFRRNIKTVTEAEGETWDGSNIKALYVGSYEDIPADLFDAGPFDAVMANEVMEHVHEPWALAAAIEDLVKPGGRVIITVPYGPWEMEGNRKMKDHHFWRAHCWHLDKPALGQMFKNKVNGWISAMPAGSSGDLRTVGNIVYSYEADHKPVYPIDIDKKIETVWPRHTIGLAVICHSDEQKILTMLESVKGSVQLIQFAQGPSSDNTRSVVQRWVKSNAPWLYTRWVDVPAIGVPSEENAKGWGFEDARNASVEGLDEFCEWTLWLDTDEYLSGNIRRYAKDHCFNALAIHQHHFTVDPRGAPPQIDRPARMFRNGQGFKCWGKVHEHFVIGVDGGPGHCHLLSDVDIGHHGYVNESIRRGRFERNFPLLKWDMKANPKRKLNKFLWFRDILHRARYYLEQGDHNTACILAQEGLDWYNDNQAEMDSFGNGTFNAFQYLGECNKILGKGLGVKITVAIFDRNDEANTQSTQFSGVTEDYEDVNRIVTKLLKGEIEQRQSKYWQ